MEMAATNTSKYRTIQFVFGINLLGIVFFFLTLGSDYYKVKEPNLRNLIFTRTGRKQLLVPNNTERVTNKPFLKVHKAGSTTMENLYFRFGMRHNLNVVMPRSGNYIFSMKNVVPLTPPKRYNIFTIHSRYTKTFFETVVPPDAVKLAIIREPVERMISGAYYYRDVWNVEYLKRIPAANFIHNLINYPEKYDTSYFSRTHNSMGFDFGFFNTLKPTDTDKIMDYLDRLNSEFSLVMTVEKFDESLIMMKRYLHWSFLDVIYLKTNSHKHKPVVLNKTEREKVRHTNFIDFAIYEYFTEVFEKRLRLMPMDFNSEVEYFQVVLDKVSTFCYQANLRNDSILQIDKSQWGNEFIVPASECKWMKSIEGTFLTYFKRTQAT